MSSARQIPETTMAAAFAEAGYQDPLRNCARDAWAKWSSGDAAGARRDYVKARLRNDLTWALIEQYQPAVLTQAIGWLLNRAKEEIEAERPTRDAGRKPAGGGQMALDAQFRHAPANPSRDAGQPAGDGQKTHDTQSVSAVTPLSRDHAKPQAERGSGPATPLTIPMSRSPAAPNLTALADKQAAASAARTKIEVRLSLLDTFKIEGQSIGDLTPNQARTWARNNSIQVRFVVLLTANLPPNDPIRKHRAAEDTDDIWRQATKEMTGPALEAIHAA